MTDGTVGIAVGCAVGIPIGVGILVALFFWYRMQQRFKQEMKEDQMSNYNYNYDEEMSLSGNGMLQTEVKEPQGVTHASSDETASSSEEKKACGLKDEGAGQGQGQCQGQDQGEGQGSGSQKQGKRRLYTPAYRKRLQQTVHSINNGARAGEFESNNSKSTSTSINSVDTPRKQSNSQVNIFDQMIPVLPDQTASASGSLFDQDSLSKRNASNETLLKTIQGHGSGAYPRRGSSTLIHTANNAAPALSSRHSMTSLHTHLSSASLNSKAMPENVFETPKSARVASPALPVPGTQQNIETEADSQGDREQEQYRLQNNYDIRDATHIAEEDQYENEFTNYSENKREFIDSLRPKIQDGN